MALFLGAFAHAEREIELQIIDYLAATGGTPPLDHPTEPIEQKEILKRQQEAEAMLKAQGVRTRAVVDRFIPNALKYYSKRGDLKLADPNWDPETVPLLEVREVNPLATEPVMSAWQYPDTPGLLARLREFGVRLFIDPTMDATGAGAIYSPRMNAILVPPSFSYTDLVHEAAHAEFRFFEIRNFIREARSTDDAEALMRRQPYLGYGEERLRKVLTLVNRGYHSNTINEAMAISAELTAILKEAASPEHKGLIHNLQRYLGRHLLNDTSGEARKRSLETEERKWWLVALAARQAVDPDDNLRKLVEEYLWRIRVKCPAEYHDILQTLQWCQREGVGILLDRTLKTDHLPASSAMDTEIAGFRANFEGFIETVRINLSLRQESERQGNVSAQRAALAGLTSTAKSVRDAAAQRLREMLPVLEPEVQHELVGVLSYRGPEAALWRALYPDLRPAAGVAEAIARLSYVPLRERLGQLARYRPLAVPPFRCGSVWRRLLSAPWRLVTSG